MSILSTILDKTSSTKSDIIFCMKLAPKESITWLKHEMESRNLGVRETAIRVGVSHPTISDIITNGKQPSFETTLALAKAFDKSSIYLLRLFGLLPPEREYVPLLDDWNAIFSELMPEEQEELIEIARLKIDRRKEPRQAIQKPSSRYKKSPARNALKEG